MNYLVMLLPQFLKFIALSGLFFLISLQGTYAQTPSPTLPIQKGILLAGGQKNQQFTLTHQVTQQDYLIQVFQPDIPAPKQGFPVVYMLDGNASFPYASIIAQSIESRYDRHQNVPPIIVAIGYPIEGTIDVKARTYDYTPPFTGEFKTQPHRPAPQFPQGGAEHFFQFIQQQLKPVIEQNYTINRNNQTLFGHSYGGLFTLYTFLNHPEAFQKYFAASPSIWWNDFNLLKAAEKIQHKNAQQYQSRTLWMSVGELENKEKVSTDQQNKSLKLHLPDIERMAAQLKGIEKLDIQTFHFAQASHFEAMFPAINQVFKLVQKD